MKPYKEVCVKSFLYALKNGAVGTYKLFARYKSLIQLLLILVSKSDPNQKMVVNGKN